MFCFDDLSLFPIGSHVYFLPCFPPLFYLFLPLFFLIPRHYFAALHLLSYPLP